MVGWLCLTSRGQRGHLETAPPFTVPYEGHEARFIHHSHRELSPVRLGCRVEVHYTIAAPRQLHTRIKQYERACGKKIFFKVSYTTDTAVFVSGICMVASWASEVILILAPKRLLQCFFV